MLNYSENDNYRILGYSVESLSALFHWKSQGLSLGHIVKFERNNSP